MSNGIEFKLEKLSKSEFRQKFHLSEKDKEYVLEKGFDVIRGHAKDFVTQKLKVKTKKDGKQTPYKGHPVFVAQHATATCCRNCLFKWHRIPKQMELDDRLITYVVDVIMTFIKKEID